MNAVTEYPQAIRDKVAAMLRAGQPNKAITDASKSWDGVPKAGVSSALIGSVAREANVLRGPGGRVVTPEQKAVLATKITGKPKVTAAQIKEIIAEAARLYAESGPVDFIELGARYGITNESVRGYLRKAGWTTKGKAFLSPPTNGAAEAPTPARPQTTPVTGKSALSLEEESQRLLLLRRLVAGGKFKTVAEVTNGVHKWPEVRLGGHNLTHVLYDLKRTGHVNFRESPGRPGEKRLLGIQATNLGRRTVAMMDSSAEPKQNEKPVEKPKLNNTGPYTGAASKEFLEDTRRATGYTGRTDGIEALKPGVVGGPVAEPTPEPTPEPDPGETLVTPATVQIFPILEGLRARAEARKSAAVKRDAYLAAASALEAVDPDEGKRLLAMASAVEGEPFSPVEAEYLAFAAMTKMAAWLGKEEPAG